MLLLLACFSEDAPSTPPAADPPPMKIEPMTHLVVENGQALYEECRDRVDPASTPGECTSDADCVRTGCNGEVCVPSDQAGEVFTTCEVRLCYHVLDSCSCIEGQCGWTLHPDGEKVETWPFKGSDPPAPAPG